MGIVTSKMKQARIETAKGIKHVPTPSLVVGVTGSRKGMTQLQRFSFESWMHFISLSEFHHGDCVGVDEEARGIVGNRCKTVAHPPIRDAIRAFTTNTETREKKEYLARNRDIVNEIEILVAMPNTYVRTPHSGTWYTISYAREKQKQLMILWPDGSRTVENAVQKEFIPNYEGNKVRMFSANCLGCGKPRATKNGKLLVTCSSWDCSIKLGLVKKKPKGAS